MVPKVESRSNRGAELLGLVAFALALMLLIALATFDPRDPAPFFKAGADATARNFIGPFGAFLAELLIPQLFGLAALLLPIALGLVGWKLFWCRPIEAPYTKAVGNLFLLLALSSLLALTFGTVGFEGEPVRAGGAIGEVLAALLVTDFNRTGAYIVAATGLFVALILSTQFSFSAFLAGTGGRVGGRLRALQTAFTHYRETRRKEKMRREVIRKHAATREEAAGLPKIRRVKAADEDEPEAEPAVEPEDDLPLQAGAARAAAGAEAAPVPGAPRRRPAEPPAAEAEPTASPRAPTPRGARTTPPRRLRDARQLHAAAAHHPRPAQGGRPAGQRPPARAREDPAAEVGRVRRDGHGARDPPRTRGHDLRVQARRRRQVLEDRRPRRRPGAGARGRVDPHRPRERQGQRRHRDPERGARDDLPARGARVRRFPPRLGPAHARPRQGRERRRLDDGPDRDAPPADRRLDRHRQERGPQLHDRLDPVPLDARRGAADPDRPEAARARGLRGHPAPADARS